MRNSGNPWTIGVAKGRVESGGTGATLPRRVEYQANLLGLRVLDPVVTRILHLECTSIIMPLPEKKLISREGYVRTPLAPLPENETTPPQRKSWIRLCRGLIIT